ncbi:MAG: DUF433 domain-containing protein [Thermosynechococcaceae cyanobacterium]
MVSTVKQHIEITPGVRGGKPRISGRRITVADIAVMHLKMGQSLDQISQEYDVSLAALYAALSYYYDHPTEIEQSIAEAKAFAEEFRKNNTSPLQQKLAVLKPNNGSDSLSPG